MIPEKRKVKRQQKGGPGINAGGLAALPQPRSPIGLCRRSETHEKARWKCPPPWQPGAAADTALSIMEIVIRHLEFGK
ncbi:hypothetical protein [Rhodoferax sp. PAMC 29310]|uniref:hypothetical protein n=1 Tax=Rhodoferax sp. PAMC 29310 TaxID=2822760 RepID=UPI001B32280F|nr:hypothetical protein [Rhodoferax sp. PAMC 29310]